MLAGLRTWWSAAANAPFLELHTSVASLVIGFVASFVIGLLSIGWSVRGLHRLPPRALLAGDVSPVSLAPSGRRRIPAITGAAALAIAVGLIATSLSSDALPEAPAFFGSGAAMLVGCFAALTVWTRGRRRSPIVAGGRAAIARLAVRNATRHPRRSLLTAGLIACATFVIVAVAANRKEPDRRRYAKDSGTGGFTLLAESALPLLHDMNTSEGQEALSLSQSALDGLRGTAVVPFRLRPGDESSCLNLYQPRRPRILGATEAAIERGGFRFASTLAESEGEVRNPWTLLKKQLPDGVVPAIGDYSAVVWLLHLGLGKDLTITDDRGREVRLRIVGLLAGSVLQGELVIAESRFVELFPSMSGYSFFLIDTPPARADYVKGVLESDLSRYGFDVGSTADRLASYMAVENTYLTTFQTLGGIGLLLGTFGLAAVLLRNVLERRGELALLRALGYRRAVLGWMVLAENAALLIAGLVAGAVSALVAVAPHVTSSPSTIPWVSLVLTLLAVLMAGLLAGLAALMPTLRSPLLPALRAE
jgi:hypothetical protein